MKSALWALGHAGTSSLGIEQLGQLGVIELLTTTAESCPHYTVRAVAMYALSLLGTTRAGADALMALNWPCVRYRRDQHWPVVLRPTTASSTLLDSRLSPSPPSSTQQQQRHQRSLSDGKPEPLLPEPTAANKPRRQRNRSESAATEPEVSRRYALPERAETPSPLSSVLRLSQQDAEGYAKLRCLQRHRRPSYSHSSLEVCVLLVKIVR